MSSKRKKIFIGLSNTAGISIRLKEGFDKLGITTDFYHYSEHPFHYKSGIIIKYSNNKILRKFQKSALTVKLLLKYKYFIYLSPNSLFPDFLDVKIFKFFRKKVMIIFVGCDIRMPENVNNFKWNPCENCTKEYQNFVGCVIPEKMEKIRKTEELFDIIVCPQEASASLKRNYVKAYFPINLEEYTFREKYPSANQKLKILHAPSSALVKGTKHIISTIEKLSNKYDFEFNLAENLSVNEIFDYISESDLIIDQMLVGFYGMFSIEAMALAKPVVCYIRNDIWTEIKKDCPVYNANPDNLYKVLEDILKNPSQLKEKGLLSRSYAEKYHDSKKIAHQYYELFEGLKN